MSSVGGASGRESASRRSASAACISSAQRRRASSLSAVLRAEHERDAEQPLHHALVQLAREVDARLEQPRAALLARGDPDARRERGGLAERPQVVALGSVSSKRLPPRSAKMTPSQRPAADTGTQQSVSTPPKRA